MPVDDPRISDLTESPKARVLLAWLAATPQDPPQLVDAYTATSIPFRRSRLYELRDNTAGLLAEAHTRLRDWRRNSPGRDTAATLGPPDGYRSVAAALLRVRAARWWWSPLRRDAQTWLCADPEVTTGAGLGFTTNYGHHWDATAPAKTFTTSTRLTRVPATALLPGHLRVRGGPQPALSAWAAPIAGTARVYEIHSPADWVRLVDRYPSHRTDVALSQHIAQDWPSRDGASGLIWTPEWGAMSQDYEGVHLSVAGWLTATSRILEIPGRGYTFCDGWPSESTRWFRNVLTGAFTRLDVEDLEYGYGQGAAGARFDLAATPIEPRRWWQWWRWREDPLA